MTSVQPLAYGYLRSDLLRDRDPNSVEQRLRTAAATLGYALGTIFYEPLPDSGTLPPAFVELVHECRRTEAHTVLTLHGHLSGMSVCCKVLEAILGGHTGATIQEIEPDE
ncbi:hypothetical protein [Nocardia macrotermitis]|uniref:Resolvase/invertase-type recombinase catalytic domain-containing protein n=1 Tax=Nocardia macrotermitis TaxID=2585198 RepID=A0A7K0D6Y0_9NOCA|nr:hypothetical protein [Nocardia macrotermitis]MQY20604.1 hypothetical protein [Nocardia macrotermitis]